MKRIIAMISAWIAVAPTTALGHTGMETETVLRLKKDSMSLVTHTSLTLAWRLLGPNAPTGKIEAAFEEAKPALEKRAAVLFELKSGNKVVQPTSVRVVLELDRHVAFVATYPKRVPATIRASFLADLGSLEPAVLSFVDETTAGFREEPAPFARIEVFGAEKVVSFTSTNARLLP